MIGVVNLLTDQTASLNTGIGTWEVASGTATLSRTRTEAKFTDIDSLAVLSGATGAVTVRTGISSIADGYSGSPFRAFAWVKVPAQMQVTASLTIVDPDETITTNGTAKTVFPGKWELVSVAETTPSTRAGDTVQVRLNLSFSSLTNATTAYVAGPAIVVPDAAGDNLFGQESYLRLPEYLRSADVALEGPTAPLFRFMDVLTSDAGAILDLWNNFRYIAPDDETGDDPGSSQLVDPQTADAAWLPWLASILGVRLVDPSTGYSSWADLETAIDANNNDIPSWSEWESVPDSADAGTTVSWDEIEELSPDTLGIEDELRWQVETAYFGINAGTRMALKEACKHFLTGTKAVTVETQVGGDPWRMRLRTLLAETPGVTAVGQESATVLEAIERAVPAGFQVSHIVD